MEKETSRAWRRHHLARIKRKRAEQHAALLAWLNDDQCRARLLGKMAQAAKPCTCWICGNRRRYRAEKTRQEISHDQLQKTSWR